MTKCQWANDNLDSYNEIFLSTLIKRCSYIIPILLITNKLLNICIYSYSFNFKLNNLEFISSSMFGAYYNDGQKVVDKDG